MPDDSGGWNPRPNNTARPTPVCELCDDTNVGAGCEVVIRHDDEIILGRRCIGEAEARYYANAFRQDHARGGWQ